ncbi:N-acetylneuraminate synthase family protein [Brevundimonas balnearis]|uniref:N-acetylneuraminate synthase family protein n=1 Tax=Brevundimonas balnearis TaxID=1572858 RepID=A0ABV6QYF9_9CAUL
MRTAAAGTTIIAEAGVNHNGDEDLAARLVEAAAEAGADAVKFQTFEPAEIAAPGAPNAEYQAHAGEREGQLAMLERLTLSRAALRRLWRRAGALGLEILSTPFDIGSARFLVEELGMGRIKVGSGELTNLPMIVDLARLGPPLMLSTGMADMEEVRDALDAVVFGALAERTTRPTLSALREAGRAPEASDIRARTVVFQCTTQYPAPVATANLRVIQAFAAEGVIPGYSDHTAGDETALAAAALGARVIEKHITLSRDLPGPDHRASMEPADFAAMVRRLRAVESALGDGDKRPAAVELGNRAVARRTLVAARDLEAGAPLTPDAVAVRRAGEGLAPADLWRLDGRPCRRAYAAGEIISRSELDA